MVNTMKANDIPMRTKVIFISILGIWTLGMHPDWLLSSVLSATVEIPYVDEVFENTPRYLCSFCIFSKMAILAGRMMAKAESIAMLKDQVA